MSTPYTDILIVALTRYADACPPALHSDCPFAVDGPDGRTCRSQCRDEVVRLSRPGHSRVSVFSSVLFDARQFLLSESGMVAVQKWHSVSLLMRLSAAVRSRPRDRNGVPVLRREIDITNALAYLGHRGYDPDWILRFGLGESLPFVVELWIGDSVVHHEAGAPDPTGGWFEIAERFMGPDRHYARPGDWLAKSQQTGFTDYIRKWVEQAPLADLWSWHPADVDEDVTTADDGLARWIMDRFTKTYVTDWAEQSLHHEYRFLKGEVEPPVPMSEMQKRSVPIADVASAIAEKAVSTRHGNAYAVIPQALLLLGEGRRKEAAALFDAARIIDPSDSDAHNNYAFCLTPDHPKEALKILRHAESLETEPLPVNRVNQAVALRILGRKAEALATAERAFPQTENMHRSGWLWVNPEDPERCVAQPVDVVTYLLNLGLELATELGNDTEVDRWRERIAADES